MEAATPTLAAAPTSPGGWTVGGATFSQAPASLIMNMEAAPVLTDDLLLARARRGEAAALETLFRAVEAPAFRLARRLCGGVDEAEDVVQETFLEVVRSVGRFRGDGPFVAWVKRIAASKALMRLRKRRRTPEDAVDPADLVDRAAARGGADDAVCHRLDLEVALARLSATARAVVWLHDVEGYTHEEIGAAFSCSASFSKSQLARAHTRLRDWLAAGRREA